MPIRVHCLRRVTDLVPQVRHSHCSASLTPLSSWLTDENCHDNDGDGGVKQGDVNFIHFILFVIHNLASDTKIEQVKKIVLMH